MLKSLSIIFTRPSGPFGPLVTTCATSLWWPNSKLEIQHDTKHTYMPDCPLDKFSICLSSIFLAVGSYHNIFAWPPKLISNLFDVTNYKKQLVELCVKTMKRIWHHCPHETIYLFLYLSENIFTIVCPTSDDYIPTRGVVRSQVCKDVPIC